jgi:6-phosphogluconolactonase
VPRGRGDFVPLYSEAPTSREGRQRRQRAAEYAAGAARRGVLGMGGDGHTASFFPELERILDPKTHRLVKAVMRKAPASRG